MTRSSRFLLLLLLLLPALAIGTRAAAAADYACGTPSAGHCYGNNRWTQPTEYFGAYTDVRQARMACPAGCGGFVDNEIWMVDNGSPGCRANRFGMCWVEAGSIALDGINSPVFFWADARPTNQSTFNLHLLGNVDPVGTQDHYMILKDGRVRPNSFLVFIYNDGLRTLYGGASTIPTGNPMAAHRIDIGQELAGTQFASADRADYTRNIWAVGPLGPEYVFWYVRQTAPGLVGSANPPTASWTISPASPPPPEGGQFTTSCCRH